MSGAGYTEHLPNEIRIRAGENRLLAIPSAAGAGCRWQARLVGGSGSTASVRVRIGRAPDPGDPPANVQAPEELEIRAMEPGRAEWMIELIRPWAPGEVFEAHRLEVMVV